MKILCRLGWHSWKEVVRARSKPLDDLFMFQWALLCTRLPFLPLVHQSHYSVGHKCRRCGVRK